MVRFSFSKRGVKSDVRPHANDRASWTRETHPMSRKRSTPPNDLAHRWYLAEWALHFGKSQADAQRALDWNKATAAFKEDASVLALEGYFPTSQDWVPGSYGCGGFLLALALCVILIGLLVFVYMLIVKPPGRLNVTYELRQAVVASDVPSADGKVCPMCAELVKEAAIICRFCGHSFAALP